MPRLSATALAALACAYACEAAEKVSALKLASGTEADLGSKEALAAAEAVHCDVLSVITLYTLICYVRNPEITNKEKSKVERRQLQDIYMSASAPDSTVKVLPEIMQEAAAILADDLPAQLEAEDPTPKQQPQKRAAAKTGARAANKAKKDCDDAKPTD